MRSVGLFDRVKREEDHVLYDEMDVRPDDPPVSFFCSSRLSYRNEASFQFKRHGLHTNMLFPGNGWLCPYEQKELRGISVEVVGPVLLGEVPIRVEVERVVAADMVVRVGPAPTSFGADYPLLPSGDPALDALRRVAREGPFKLQPLESFRVVIHEPALLGKGDSIRRVRIGLHGPMLRADLSSPEWVAQRAQSAAAEIVRGRRAREAPEGAMQRVKSDELEWFDSDVADEEGTVRLFVEPTYFTRPFERVKRHGTDSNMHGAAVPNGFLKIVELLTWSGERGDGAVEIEPRLLGEPIPGASTVIACSPGSMGVRAFPLFGLDPFDVVVRGLKPDSLCRVGLVGPLFKPAG